MSELGIFYPNVPSGGTETVEVRVNTDDGVSILISCPYIAENAFLGHILQRQNTSNVYNVPILENGAYLTTEKKTNLECNITGNCEIVEDEYFYVVHITGNCEINFAYTIS